MKDQNARQYEEGMIRVVQSQERVQTIRWKLKLAKPVNESSLYDLVENEGEDGSDGLERSESCQGWEGIATL